MTLVSKTKVTVLRGHYVPPRFELKQTKIENKLQQKNKQLDSLLAYDKPLK